MELNILRADPAGNITVFVLDPVEKAQRAAIAEKIMAIPALKAEQVGYACAAEDDVDGHMEMMGGEFCGNATRAYGMYIAQQKGGLSSVRLRVSGCDHAVTAQVDLKSGTARAEMPCPRSVKRVTVNGHEGTLVDLTGIAHFVVEGVEPSEDFFRAAESIFSGIAGLDACGVIFLNAENRSMTPLVKVIETGSLVSGGQLRQRQRRLRRRAERTLWKTAVFRANTGSPRAQSAQASSAKAETSSPRASAARSRWMSPCASRCDAAE